jgi:hypothetical protein
MVETYKTFETLRLSYIDSELGMMLQTMTMEDLGYAASSTTTR